MTKYKRLDEKAWLDFGKTLLDQQGSEKQKEFLTACRSGKDDFLRYLETHLFSTENSIIDGDTVAFEYKFSAKEFCHPQRETEKIIWDVFKEVPDAVKSSCGFWGYTIISMIQDNYIFPDYLA